MKTIPSKEENKQCVDFPRGNGNLIKKKITEEINQLLFEKHNALIPLDYIEEQDELSVNVEEFDSNIIVISTCSSESIN